MKSDVIEIYVDGGCHGNSSSDKELSIGAHGYILLYKDKIKEYSHAENNTTNNKQELLGVIKALETLKKTDISVLIYADSRYVIGCATEWLKSWKRNGWRTANKEPVKNKELIQELDNQLSRFRCVEFVHVKGHSGNEFNERVDKLCTYAIEEFERNLVK